jgi:hypothetical protein
VLVAVACLLGLYLSILDAYPATIVDSLRLPDGNPYVGQVVFRAATNRVVVVPPYSQTPSEVIARTDTAGRLVQTLSANYYTVTIGNALPFRISVPNDAGKYTPRRLQHQHHHHHRL